MQRQHIARSDRHCTTWEATLKMPGRAPMRTRLYDVNRTGVRVRLNEFVSAGQALPIEIELRAGETVTARIVIIWCRAVPAGYFIAGAKLLGLSPPDRRRMEAAVEELGTHLANSFASRRRFFPGRLLRGLVR